MRPGKPAPYPEVLASTAKAMDMMSYDAGFLSQKESDMLARLGITPPLWQQTASAAPFTTLATASGEKIGILRFPSLKTKNGKPGKELIDRLSRDIRKYHKTVRLIIGLSDWGWLGEQEYLAANPETVPDLLLGSGRGSGSERTPQGRCPLYLGQGL